MIPLELSTVTGVVYGRLVTEFLGSVITDVSADSRGDMTGKLFVPIKGEHFNGHDFIAQAFEKGAACAFCEERRDFPGLPVIYVDGTLKALKRLAFYYRNLFDVKVVGITGSVGKTTVKDLCASVLGQRYNTLKTYGNLNTDIGLPLTLFGLGYEHEFAVLEMGMRNFGEIRELAEIAKPDVAIITNIGVSHIENLGSRENILRAKLEILDGLRDNGKVILNGDDDMLASLRNKYVNTVYYGYSNDTASDNLFIAEDIEYNGTVGIGFTLVKKGGGRIRVGMNTPGRHMVSNALCAAALGDMFSLELGEIKRGIESFIPSNMRMGIMKTSNGVTIINDTYNASPDSMRAAFNVLENAEGRKICVLGDMLELGPESDNMHRELGVMIAQKGFDYLIAYGDKIMLTVEECERTVWENHGKTKILSPDSKADAIDYIKSIMLPGDSILVKASRGMYFEDIVKKVSENDV